LFVCARARLRLAKDPESHTNAAARSAFARLVRETRLTAEEHAKAIRLLHQLRPGWDEILPSEKVRSLAEDLPDSHILRAGDAAQLAAALVWCRERPKKRSLMHSTNVFERPPRPWAFRFGPETSLVRQSPEPSPGWLHYGSIPI